MDWEDPERQLALAYLAPARRLAVSLVWQLDARLGRGVPAATNPAVEMLKLAWWRDALIRLDGSPAPPEPLLQGLHAAVTEFVPGARLAMLAEAWGGLLEGEADPVRLDSYGSARGGALFGMVATILGESDVRIGPAGAGWALVDLAYRTPDPILRGNALVAAMRAFAGWDGRVARPLRPLGMLAVLARADAAAGAQDRRQGSPIRVARMLRYALLER